MRGADFSPFPMNTHYATRFHENNKNDAGAAAVKAGKKADAAYDSMLVGRFNSGDEAAFAEIIKRYYPRIRALAQQTLRNEADAEEVAQDTFIRAHKGLATFRGDSSLATWLYCIGLNLARNRYWYFFRRRRQDTYSFDQPVLEGSTTSLAEVLPAGTTNPRSETMTDEFSSLIADCMERLDSSHREILTMRSMLDLSYEEIAMALGINVGTVKSRIARARESLRSLLMQSAPEFGKESAVSDFFETARPLPGASAVLV
jgi:RNA polymerase sigma-70 factor, ECF subfamily